MTGARRATVMLINGYIDVMRQQVKGEWTVHHQLGHVCGEAQEVPVEGPLDNGRMGQLGC